jgi:hypothetical protein
METNKNVNVNKNKKPAIDVLTIINEVKNEIVDEMQQRFDEEEIAQLVLDKIQSKTSSVTVSITRENLRLLDKIKENDPRFKSRSAVVKDAVGFYARLIAYNQVFDKVVLEKTFIHDREAALDYIINEYLLLNGKIENFDQRLLDGMQTINLVAENLQKFTILQRSIQTMKIDIDKLVTDASRMVNAAKSFTDKFGIQRGIKELQDEMGRLSRNFSSFRGNINIQARTATIPSRKLKDITASGKGAQVQEAENIEIDDELFVV